MLKSNKRMHTIYKKVDKNKQYTIDEAISILKSVTTLNFVESVDVAVNLDIDTRKFNQNTRGTAVLPHGTGKCIRIAVFAEGENAIEAKKAGADMVGMMDLVEYIKKHGINFDLAISTPDAMNIVNSIAQILNSRGIMPNKKTETITSNITKAIENARKGQIFYRNDKNGIVHFSIGKINFEPYKLKENLEVILNSIKMNKPVQVKGSYIRNIKISTTMGPGISIDQTSLINSNINSPILT